MRYGGVARSRLDLNMIVAAPPASICQNTARWSPSAALANVAVSALVKMGDPVLSAVLEVASR